MGTPTRTINDLYEQMQQVNGQIQHTNDILTHTNEVLILIYQRVEKIGIAEEPYTREEYDFWRKPFGEAILSSPALVDRRAKNALIRAASFDTAHRHFLDHNGRLMPFARWIQAITIDRQRALRIRNVGQVTVNRLIEAHGE